MTYLEFRGESGPTPDRPPTPIAAPAWGDAIPSMFRTARRVLGCDHLADDAVQETLVHAWTNGRLEHAHHGALCCLAHLTSLEIRRSRTRLARREAVVAERRRHESAPDPAVLFEAHDCATEVRRALDELPADCGEPLRRFLLYGEPYATIASSLDLPIGTVRSRIARARRLLRARLTRAGLALPGNCQRRSG